MKCSRGMTSIKLIDVLLPQIRSIGTITSMVMITRGGVIPGGMLAEALDIQHVLTAAVDFPAKLEGPAGLMALPKFLQFPEPSLVVNRRTLIVDDVWGSGRTSIAVRQRVLSAGGTALQLRHALQSLSVAVHQRKARFLWRGDGCLRRLSLGSRPGNARIRKSSAGYELEFAQYLYSSNGSLL